MRYCKLNCQCGKKNKNGLTLRDWLILDGAIWARRIEHIGPMQVDRRCVRRWRAGEEPNRNRFPTSREFASLAEEAKAANR